MDEIGSSLREARMHARIDITEVEAATKIRAKYLRALENEEWDLLPGPVYVRSFLKTYGDFLGLDSRLLVDEFKRRYEGPTDYEVRTSSMASGGRERERDRGAGGGSVLAQWLFSPRGLIVVAIVVIIAALYVIGSHGSKNNDSARVTPSTNTTGAGAKHHAGGGKGQSGKAGAGKGAGGSGTTTSQSGTTTTPTTSTTGTNTTTTPPDQATLAMTATADVWVCIEGASGRVLAPTKTYTAGEQVRPVHSTELLVTLGNTHVTMTVNGKPYTPTGSSAIGLRITPQGATPLSSAPTCGA